MERLVEERELTIPTSKAWDPYQLYLKRLISTMAKDPSKIFYLSSSKFFY
jgi:hypothetical protein